MASKTAFKAMGTAVPTADAKNHHGTVAYDKGAKTALAQLAVTGCFNQTYYSTPEDQLSQVLNLAKQVDPEFIAKLAIYARESGFMKDMPASLVVYLTTVDAVAARKAFPRVINNGKMLRNFAQIVRSGAFGRANLSSATMKRLVGEWFESRTDDDVFFSSVGTKPSIGDVLRMARPSPKTKERSALFAYLIGKKSARFADEEFEVEAFLSPQVAAYEAYRKNPQGGLPRAPFEMLLGLTLQDADWKTLATRATWTQTFKSLNTFARHGVFNDAGVVKLIADKLRDEKLIKGAKVFPYQILMAYKAVTEGARGAYTKDEQLNVPREIIEAVQDAMEIATDNVPVLPGNVVLCPDVSGSMSSATITGTRKGSTSMVRCIDVAGLLSAIFLRRNSSARVLPFEGVVHQMVALNPRDSIMTNTRRLSAIQGGATNCAAPLEQLNRENATVDFVVFVSDYESWSGAYGASRGTPMMEQWVQLKAKNPNAKLICIDLTPQGTAQAPDREEILNVGGFSDRVFDVITAFTQGTKDHWVETIEKVEL